MEKSRVAVFDIGHFSLHDGPGIRTTVFLKGCPLRCLWCHNPESQSGKPALLFSEEKCIGCGTCFPVCPEKCHSLEDGRHFLDRDRCLRCGRCAAVCPSRALELCGRMLTPEEVMKEVRKDRIFYQTSGGGVTVSGGEPLAHTDFVCELLELSHKEGIHTCVETSGYATKEEIQRLIPLVDLWLWDFKASREDYPRLTGVDAEKIRNNLLTLDRSGAAIVLRCPWIPSVNDSAAYWKELFEHSAQLKQIQRIELEPYNPLGEEKYARLGQKAHCTMPFPSREAIQKRLNFLRNHTSIPVAEG